MTLERLRDVHDAAGNRETRPGDNPADEFGL
jgi:hypothetical protein